MVTQTFDDFLRVKSINPANWNKTIDGAGMKKKNDQKHKNMWNALVNSSRPSTFTKQQTLPFFTA